MESRHTSATTQRHSNAKHFPFFISATYRKIVQHLENLLRVTTVPASYCCYESLEIPPLVYDVSPATFRTQQPTPTSRQFLSKLWRLAIFFLYHVTSRCTKNYHVYSTCVLPPDFSFQWRSTAFCLLYAGAFPLPTPP